MALLYFEGFVESSNINSYPPSFQSGGGTAIQQSGGKNYIYLVNGNSVLTIPLGVTAQNSFYCGMRVIVDNAGQSFAQSSYVGFQTSSHLANFQIYFNTSNLTFNILDVSGNYYYLPTANLYSFGVPFYMEVFCTIGNPGLLQIKINGSLVYANSSINTKVDSNNQNLTYLYMYNQYAPTSYITDLYVCDNTTSYNNTFLGPVSVINTYATSSLVSSFTPVGAANNISVDNTTPPNITNIYNTSGTVGAYDLFKTANVFTPNITSVLGVQMVVYANTPTPNSSTISTIIQSNGVNSISNAFAIGSTALYYPIIKQVDPSTNVPWTISGVANANVGYINVS